MRSDNNNNNNNIARSMTKYW